LIAVVALLVFGREAVVSFVEGFGLFAGVILVPIVLGFLLRSGADSEQFRLVLRTGLNAVVGCSR